MRRLVLSSLALLVACGTDPPPPATTATNGYGVVGTQPPPSATISPPPPAPSATVQQPDYAAMLARVNEDAAAAQKAKVDAVDQACADTRPRRVQHAKTQIAAHLSA